MPTSAGTRMFRASTGGSSRPARIAAPLLVALFVGCTSGKDSGGDGSSPPPVYDYRDAMAVAYCDIARGCDGFETIFGTVEECEYFWRGFLAADICVEYCTFDAELGSQCLEGMASLSCDSECPTVCSSVFDCGEEDPQNCGSGLCPL